MNEDILYTPEEIAQKLKITKGTVYEMIKRNDMEAHRIGRHIRVSQTQFENYLIKSKGYDNVYDAIISHEDSEVIASIGDVKIFAVTEIRGKAKISIRPENIILSKGTFTSSARNSLKGNVTGVDIEGSKVIVTVDIGVPIKALITVKSMEELDIQKGTELYAVFKTMSVVVYK